MLQQLVSILALAALGALCASNASIISAVRRCLGHSEHQVIKRRRLPNDASARGGPFFVFVGCLVGTSVSLVSGLQLSGVLLACLVSSVAGFILSRQRVSSLGEQYLKRAHANIHVKQFAEAIQDANEAFRCSSRYQDEAKELVFAAKTLRLAQGVSDEVQASSVASKTLGDRRRTAHRVF